MLKISKFIQINNLILLIGLVMVFSGCSSLNQNSTNSNQNTNSTNANKPVETPTATPKVEPTATPTASNSPETNTNSNKPVVEKSKGKSDDKITQANFDKINNGMSLDEVRKIFDDEGMKISDMTIHGKHSEMYMWFTDNMKKKIRVTFEKVLVVEKEKDGF